MFNLKFKGLCVYPYILPNTNESMVSYHPHGVATFRDLHPAPHFFKFRNMPWASWHNEMCRNSHDKCGSCQLQVGASLPCSVEWGPYNLHADLVDRRFLQSSVISFCNFCNDHVFRHSLNHHELVQDFSHEQYVSNLLYSIVVAPKECQGNVLPIWSLQIMNKAEDCAMVFQAIASPPITANSRICLVRILTIRHRHPSSFETINHHQPAVILNSLTFFQNFLENSFRKGFQHHKINNNLIFDEQNLSIAVSRYPISSYVARDPKSSRWKCHVALRRPPGFSSCRQGGEPVVETEVFFLGRCEPTW